MEEILAAFWSVITDGFFAFYHGKIFFAIKIFLMIYSAVLIVNVILLVYLDNPRNRLRTLRKGASTVKAAKRVDVREWRAVMERLASDDVDQYKVALLEGDRMVYKSLELQGYSGANFAERLSQLPAGSLQEIDAVRDVHALCNKVVQDKDVEISKEQASNALGVYEQFLKSLDIL